MEALGKCYGDLLVACERAKIPLIAALLVGWTLFPVAVKTVIHPTQAIGFQYWVQSQPVPRFYTWHQATVGEIEALLALGALILLMLGATVLFDRRAKFFVRLWVVPAVLIGIVGNAAWWIDKGFFDRPGVLAGFASVALMVACQVGCEKLGADFVFGKGNRPSREATAGSWG